MRPDPDSWDDPRGAEIYAEIVREGTVYRSLAASLVEALQPRASGCYLDLATGTGVCAGLLLARAGMGIQILGIDASPIMLQVASEELPLPEVGLAVADPAALPCAAETFDGALCSAAFWHLPAPGRVLAEVARVLRRSGRFAFNVPAAQLDDCEDLPPSAFQLALVREGLRLFGEPPSPGGPVRRRPDLITAALETGFELAGERTFEITVPQSELIDLLEVPAIGGRLYPQATPAQLHAWMTAAAARISKTDPSPSRWWEVLFEKR